VASGATAATPQARDAAVAAARGETSASDDRAAMHQAALVLGILAALGLLTRHGRRGRPRWRKPERDLTAAE